MAMNIEEIRSLLPFQRAYNFEIEFPDYGATPFPATELGETAWSYKNDDVDYGVKTFQYPSGAGGFKQFNVTLIETEKADAETWLKKWKSDLIDDEFGITLLADAHKDAILYRYDLSRGISSGYPKMVQVVPDGEVSYNYSSDKTSVLSLEVTFFVVGTQDGD